MRRNHEGVSPVIGTILLVGITVVLAATLYIMAFGFGANTDTPPVGQVTLKAVEGGFQFEFTPFSKETTWGDLQVVLIEGNHSAAFANMTTSEMKGDYGHTKCFGCRALGTLEIFMNATDLAGNGYINQGDHFTLTTSGGQFLDTIHYDIYLLYRPNGAQICTMSFQGGQGS
jgi:flagellin-like protein